MNKTWLLSKALLKNNYNLSFKSKKGLKSIAIVILLALCMLPMMFMMFSTFSNLFASGIGNLAISTGLSMSCMLVVFTSILMYPSTFFFSKDTAYLLPLPVSSASIVIAKALVVISGQLPVMLLAGVPLFAAYIVSSQCTILGAIVLFLGIFLAPSITAVAVGIFILLLMRLMPFFANKDRFNLIAGLISMVSAVGIGISSSTLSSQGAEDPSQLIEVLKNSKFLTLSDRIFIQNPLITGVVLDHSLMDFVLFIAVGIIFSLVFLFTAQKLYFKTALSSSSQNTKIKNVKAVKEGSPALSYLKTEYKSIFRSPSYLTNCVLAAFLVPLMLVVMIFVVPEFKELRELGAHFPIQEMMDLPALGLLIGVGAGMFSGSMSSLSGTVFSRMGQNISFMKYIPMPLEKQIQIKSLSGILLSIPAGIIYLIPFHYLVNYPIYVDILYLIAYTASSVLVNMIGVLIDAYHPKLIWDDETAAIKNNLNAVFDVFAGILLSVIVFIPLMIGMDLSTAAYVEFILVLILAAASWILIPKISAKLIQKIN